MRINRLLAVPVILLLTACGDDLPSAEELSAVVASQDQHITELETELEQMTIDLGGSSLKKVEGATSATFNYVDDAFVFPVAQNIEGAQEDFNNSIIRVGSTYTFAPSNNWVSRIEGVTLNLSHPLGIIGTIKALNITGVDMYGIDRKALLQDFVATLPVINTSYSNIYTLDTVTGSLATSEITIEGRTGYLMTGLVARNEKGLLFSFVVDSTDNTTAKEMVRLLLATGKEGNGDRTLTLE